MKVYQLPIGTEFGIFLSPEGARVPRVKRMRLLKKGPASALVVNVGESARREFVAKVKETGVAKEGEAVTGKKLVTFEGASSAYHIAPNCEAEIVYD